MWKSFKSWWYWNMPDWEDLLFYGGMTLILTTSTWGFYDSYIEEKEYISQCESSGGVLIRGVHHQFYCIKKGEVITWN